MPLRVPHLSRRFQILVAVTALFVMAGAASAASFAGQGLVAFDSVRVGKNDSKSDLHLQGPIKNPGKYPDGKGRPINISDNVVVKGDVTVQNGDLLFSGSSKGWIRAPGANTIVGIDDSLQVTGTALLNNVDITGALTAGPYNVGVTIVSNAGLTTRLSGFVTCLGGFTSFGPFVETDDYVFCYNIWLAGQPGSVSFSSSTSKFATPEEFRRSQIENATRDLGEDPVKQLSRPIPTIGQ